jgi:hypothetical protein
MAVTKSHSSIDVPEPPSGVLETLGKLVIEEALIAIFVLSVLSALWAVAAPRWLEGLLRRSAMKAAFAAPLFAGILLWVQHVWIHAKG